MKIARRLDYSEGGEHSSAIPLRRGTCAVGTKGEEDEREDHEATTGAFQLGRCVKLEWADQGERGGPRA